MREESRSVDAGGSRQRRRVVSESPAQRLADATMAKLRNERAEARRARLRDSRVSGRRARLDPPDDAFGAAEG